jgi:hypothetical protein
VQKSRLTIAFLLLLTTAVALLVSLTIRGMNGSHWSGIFATMLQLVFINFGLFGILFVILYPLGKLNQFLEKQTETVQSPFAADRLPERQIEIPVDSETAH